MSLTLTIFFFVLLLCGIFLFSIWWDSDCS